MKTTIIFLVALLSCSMFKGWAQDTTLLDFTFYKTENPDLAQYKQVRFTHPKNHKIDIEEIYYVGGELYSRKWIRINDNVDNVMAMRVFSKDGQLKEDVKYNGKSIDGELFTYWPNGEVKRKDIFKNGTLIKGQCYDNTGMKIDYCIYNEVAHFPGGKTKLNEFINEKLVYPDLSKKNYEEGVVHVSFLVDTMGVLTDIKYESSGYDRLDAEVLRVLNLMPKWIPSTHDGEKLITRIILPVTFEIPPNHNW